MKFPIFSKTSLKIGKVLSERKQGLHFLIYNLSGNGLTLLMNFVLPFFLTAAGYGKFALFYALYNLLTAIFTFGLDSTILKFSLDKKGHSNVVIRSFFVWLLLSFLAFLLIVPITWYCSSHGILKASFGAAMMTIVSAFIVSFQRIILFYYIAKSEIKKYGILFVFNKVAQFLVFVLPVVVLMEEKSVTLMPYLFLAQSVLTFLLILYLERKQLILSLPTKIETKALIKFTLPLSFETFGNIGYSYGFNLLISPFLSLSQLGILNIYTQLGNIISMTSGAFNNGYLPRFFLHLEENFKETVKKYYVYIRMNTSLITACVFALGVAYKYLTDSSKEDYTVLMLLVYLIGIFVYSFKSIGSSYLIIKSKTMKIALITIITSVLNIGIGMIITKHFGFEGCIFSLSIGYCLQMFLFNFEVIKKYLTEKKSE